MRCYNKIKIELCLKIRKEPFQWRELNYRFNEF